MSESNKPAVGMISWTDLTVPNAVEIRDFYSHVVGWMTGGVDMGGYEDFNMIAPATGTPVAGVCHARGVNADLPAQWLMYVIVENLDVSLSRCVERSGHVIAGPKNMGAAGRYGVIQDPVGAVIALFEAKS
jgi:hypothetical protein